MGFCHVTFPFISHFPLLGSLRSEFSEVLRQQAVPGDDSEALRFDKVLGVDKAGPDVALIKLQRLGWEIQPLPGGKVRHFKGED